MPTRGRALGGGLLAGALAFVPAHAELLAGRCGLVPPPPPPPVAPPVPAPAAPSEFPYFELKDGTRVVGGFGQAAFLVETPYGTLSVPVQEVIQVRFGMRSDPALGLRIDALIRQLGDADFNRREEASQGLQRIGSAARKALEQCLKAGAGDAEIQERAGSLLEALDVSEEEAPPENDEILTKRFLVRGTLQCPHFQVATKYGSLRIEKHQVQRLVLQSCLRRLSVKVPGARSVQDGVDTRLRLKRGDSLRIRAKGAVTLANWSQQCGPEGNPNCGQQIPGFQVGTLLGRIGTNGPPFRIGADYQGTAERDGTLFLALALQQNCAQQNTGEFLVEISAEDQP